MFVIVPAIIIFLCISYLYLNDTNIYAEIFIYGTIFLTIALSSYLYKIIQKDLKQQERNSIQLEINKLIEQLNITSDELHQKSLKHKIEVLQKELTKD
ncbi:MAG: hypothetical protein KAJ49_02635 [Arcobacteraceae bacterium]|nr:hypothetical protein [Arcobacteraceae bacterium]